MSFRVFGVGNVSNDPEVRTAANGATVLLSTMTKASAPPTRLSSQSL